MALDSKLPTAKLITRLTEAFRRLASDVEGERHAAANAIHKICATSAIDLLDLALHHGGGENETEVQKANEQALRWQGLYLQMGNENARLERLLVTARTERYNRREKELREAQSEIKRLSEALQAAASQPKNPSDTEQRIRDLEAQVAALTPKPDPWVALVGAWLDNFDDWRVASVTLLTAACGLPVGQHDNEAFIRLKQVMASFPAWSETSNVPLAGKRVRGYLRRG